MIAILFESPWLLLVLLAAMQFGLLMIWWRRRTRAWSRIVIAGLAAMATLPLLSHLIVTPRERIVRTCRELAVMVEAGDVAGIGGHLADDFEVAGMNRTELLVRVEKTIKRYVVENVRLHAFAVIFPRKDEGVAEFNAVCRIRSAEMPIERLLSRWRLTFRGPSRGQGRGQGRDGSWQVTKIEVVPTPLSPIRNVRDWLP